MNGHFMHKLFINMYGITAWAVYHSQAIVSLVLLRDYEIIYLFFYV